MGSRYDDELWELVPEEPGPPPQHVAAFVRSLGYPRRALDLGCGDGRVTALLGAREVTGADVSEVALTRASRRVPSATLVALQPDADLPFADGSFDLVLCTETLEHVRDTQTLMSEIRRVLTPGGKLALTTPAHARATAAKLLVRGFESGFNPLSPHLRFYTGRSLNDLLDATGFGLTSIVTRRGTLLATATR